MNALQIGFAGTPAFAATILTALIEAGRMPVVVLSQPDRPSGRGKRVKASPVKQLAIVHEIPVTTPSTLRSTEVVDELSSYGLDVLIVAAYGLILPEAVLCLPRFGCVNVHASMLPRWRGAAPIERAIMAGDPSSGVSIMQMDAGLDTGPILLEKAVSIVPATTGKELEESLATLGATLLLDVLEQLTTGNLAPRPQEGEPSYANKLLPTDSQCDWSQPAPIVERQVRALAHRAPVYSKLGTDRVRILDAQAVPEPAGDSIRAGTIVRADKSGIRVACGEGQLEITSAQLSRGKGTPLTPADLLNGYGELFQPGAQFYEAPG